MSPQSRKVQHVAAELIFEPLATLIGNLFVNLLPPLSYLFASPSPPSALSSLLSPSPSPPFPSLLKERKAAATCIVRLILRSHTLAVFVNSF